ncbi:DNA repair protein RecO [Aequitasia blattaphilus]|uniref:DNA repair protein RecO n=1 Tax=Aequitasia blattaphilus TaxID=2949332 RepID=A0ABT1EA90_9FIRM|nr:DNA repair protein RecO [Aequitasia blattaphilus]MCP1102755.1 DNA repair protein RecO [Aequitasia blattaphilus]MCR8615395.1 DNA repair protein RecO [Aequitasia blattaphilus]
MNQISVTGMVIYNAPAGEYDRRVVLLTKERGKITAFARGARKPNSSLIAATTPFVFGEFVLYEGRTSYTLNSAKPGNYFESLRHDLEGAYYGIYFLDLIHYYAREGTNESESLKLIYQTLRALESDKIPNPLIRRVFELKLITINGEGPQVFQCQSCGSREYEDVYFSVDKGGLLLGACKGDDPSALRIGQSTLYALQYIVSSSVEKLYSFVVKEEVQRELDALLEAYLEKYLDKNFRSREILESLS